jgi:hypothetical protein
MNTTPNQAESPEQHIRNLTGQLVRQSRINSRLARDRNALRDKLRAQAEAFHAQLDLIESAMEDVTAELAIARSIIRRPR